MKNNKKFLMLIFPWLIWGLGCLFYCHQYLLRVSVSSLSTELVKHFHVTSITLSNIAASFFYAYVICQIPSGILIDRFGAKAMFSIASFSCAAGCLFFGFAQNLAMIEIGRIFMGAGAAFALIITLALAKIWFSEHLFPTITGLTITVGTLGAVLGGTPLTILGQDFGRKYVMFGAFIICIILALVSLYIIRDNPQHTKSQSKIPWGKTLLDLLHELKNPTVWLVGLLMASSLIPLFCFGTLWSKPFLKFEYHITNATASLAPSLIFIGTAIGAPAGGLISKYFTNKLNIILSANFASLIIILISVYVTGLPLALVLFLFFLLGFAMGFPFLGLTIAKDIATPKNTAAILGIVNVIYNLAGALSLPLVGYLLNKNWDGKILFNTRIYNLPDYHSALAIMPVSIVLAIIIGLILKHLLKPVHS